MKIRHSKAISRFEANVRGYLRNSAFGRIREDFQLASWVRNGRTSPPPHFVKRENVVRVVKERGAMVMVESGTYLGQMVEALENHVPSIISIEIDDLLFQQATSRFSTSRNVEILHGDTAELLPSIVSRLPSPALFWLDGHFSGGVTSSGKDLVPILEELKAVSQIADKNPLILIDDVRLFDGTDGYPTRDGLEATIKKLFPRYRLSERDDIFFLLPTIDE